MVLDEDKKWYALKIDEVFERLGTSRRGLSPAETKKRLQEYGQNELEEGGKTTRLEILIAQIKNPLIAVLAGAALISFLAGKQIDAAVIIAVIALNTALGFFKEFKAEEAISALMSHAAPEAEVLRAYPDKDASHRLRIKAREIVPGDIILVEAGGKVPADARIIEAMNLEVDESMLTGESVPSRKKTDALKGDLLSNIEMDNILFAGTIVTQGRGNAVVFSTGMATEMGKIARLISKTQKTTTPLKKRTMDLGRNLMLLAVLASSLTFIVGFLRGFELIDLFLFTVAMAVSAIPEGLPAAITITLAVGVSRMAKRHAIIRKLDAVETLGSVTAICTDKTGTLTTNQMTVQKILLVNRMVDVTGVGFKPEGDFEVEGIEVDAEKDGPLKTFLQIAALCNDSGLEVQDAEEGGRWQVQGDPTEGALIVASAKAGLYKEELEQTFPRIDEISFNPNNRYMATFHRNENGDALLYLKGAPETVLAMCSGFVEDGEVKNLGQKEKQELLERSTEMAAGALRVLAMASRTLEFDEIAGFKKEGPSSLIFAGFSGMMDPPRPEAIDAVNLCKRAGIKVFMATGDHKITAEAIAREMGILEGASKVYSGSDLDEMTNKRLDEVIHEASVFARVSPEHKHRIVEALRRKGHVVAMTGDGINDAPALKASDIGIAMGITGSDVTKETADMILTDDNFQSIVNAVEEGRVIFENIRKVVKYLISTSAGEILTIVSSLVLLSLNALIFTPVQVLWVNLVTDGLLVVNLAMEPREEDVMDEPPRKPKEKIINREIVKNTLFVAAFMAVGTLFIFTREWNGGDILRAQTMGFTTMAMFQVFNAINCRSRIKSVFSLGLFSNKYLVVGIAASIILQFLVTEFSFFHIALGTVSLSAMDWVSIFAVSSTVFFAEEVRKAVKRKKGLRL